MRLETRRIVMGVVATLLVCGIPAAGHAADEARLVAQGAEQVGEAVPGVPLDIDLRDLPVLEWQPGDPIRDVPRRDDGTGEPVNTPGRLDPILQAPGSFSGAPAVTDVLTFNGNVSGANPNDPTMDVGVDFIMQAINGIGGSSVTVYNKSDGMLVAGPFPMDTLGGTARCANGSGDPIILFDDIAQRWVLLEFGAGPNDLCVYVARTADPIGGGWCHYQIVDTFPDYPKFGVWPDAYYMAANQGASVPIYAFDRVNMLSPDGTTCPTARPGQKLSNQVTQLAGLGFELLIPVHQEGATGAEGNEPGIYVRQIDEELHSNFPNNAATDIIEMYTLAVDFDTSANTTLTQLPDIVVADFDSNLCPPVAIFSCIPMPGSGTRLDPLLEVIMNVPSYHNMGSHESIVLVFQLDIGDFADHSGERWVELRRSGGGDWALHQEGTYSPDSDHRFMGMINMDSAGNILLAYNVSSSTVHPSIRYTGRAAMDPMGMMTVPETEVHDGAAVNSSSRYGDYNQMGVDPVDGCTFWFIGMYNPAGKANGISAVRFDSCAVEVFMDGFESGNLDMWSLVVIP